MPLDTMLLIEHFAFIIDFDVSAVDRDNPEPIVRRDCNLPNRYPGG